MMTLMDIVLFCLSAFLALYFYCKYKFNYFKLKGVPHEQPTFPFGNILDVFMSGEPVGQYIGKLCLKSEGQFFGFYALTKPFLIIKDPKIVKNILIKDFHVFSNRHVHVDPNVEPILAYSLLGMKTPQWKTLRKQISPVFTSGKIKMMMPLMAECGKNLEKYLSGVVGQDIEMKHVANMYTTDVIATCAFGVDANSFSDGDNELLRYGRMIFPKTALQSLKTASYFLAPSIVKFFKYRFINEEVDRFFRNVFRNVISQREASKVKRNDLADILIEIKNQDYEESDFKFDENILTAQALIFFGAGHETTSSTISFALHELCFNPSTQDKLRDEIHTVIGKHDGLLTYEAVQDMKYLHMVVSETLRKYPLTPFINRECGEDYKVEGTEMLIEKGTPVLISQDALHLNPKYFPNPEKFDPERFSAENIRKIENYTYLPFGDGPRLCIGERFALLSTKLGIIHMVKNFKMVGNSQSEELLKFSRIPLRTAKNGVHMTCIKI
ncbi:cytochrome P450 6k1-like [Photinus pyralis]|uniref:Cytochrome P450 n=1 Tax=Photinus pyralis TaxID=7054 RepID=A0A1Y1LXA0_PHOPY|nr:cytochrome P450 6k1-like [Photinus pyralis]